MALSAGQGREGEITDAPGKMLLGSISCIFHFMEDFDNREVGGPPVCGWGKWDGIKDSFLEEALLMPISEHR